jgi:hypothetical protein
MLASSTRSPGAELLIGVLAVAALASGHAPRQLVPPVAALEVRDDADKSACQPSRTRVCNTLEAKVPSPWALHALPSITSGLSEADARTVERALALAIGRLPFAEAATAEFMRRLRALVEGATDAPADDALTLAFGTGSPANTGYAGSDVETLRAILERGNSRERWALVYVLQKNHHADTLLDRAHADSALALRLGLDLPALRARGLELAQTRANVAPASWYSNGIADWLFPPFSSWVRFDFDSAAMPTNESTRADWRGCRQLKPSGCLGTDLRSDDPSIVPPLSPRELEYQCGAVGAGAGEERAARACALSWQPGASCYNLLDVPLGALPGYAARARHLGYVAVAGPSGTTANTLQLGRLLGLADDGSAIVLRAALLSWLVLSHDHSAWEVLLGAEAFVPAAARMADAPADQPALCAFGRLLPGRLAWRGQRLGSSDVWAGLVAELAPTAVWGALGERRRAYFECLAAAHEPEACCVPSGSEEARTSTAAPQLERGAATSDAVDGLRSWERAAAIMNWRQWLDTCMVRLGR